MVVVSDVDEERQVDEDGEEGVVGAVKNATAGERNTRNKQERHKPMDAVMG